MSQHRIYRSLRPILFAGAERELAILEGTLICSLLFGVGFHLLTVAMAGLIAFGVHPLLVLAAKNDAQMFRIYVRSLAQQDLYLARAHPSAPPYRCLPWPPL